MSAALKHAPNVKVNEETSQLISDAAHHLGKTRKDVVEEAVREYLHAHMPEIHASIHQLLQQLDGTRSAAVSVMTGLSKEELEELGGFAS
ncbi:hypothetical protein M3B43_03225 [Nesterenkonia massiliensis]|uniref:Ribbon-helix-helix protein CopG domain-containing protein n=1 Tax=Nesterenkonia massiliensis TaxID=1232429 RepID=A0ABT2HP77_9MICC|nr:hypothetical protein [Nesterenkonia massiliensis]MCT1606350.1 hypothetical protein [Nesterenkonia massiliensis]